MKQFEKIDFSSFKTIVKGRGGGSANNSLERNVLKVTSLTD